jgi:Cof subfamily protein (haloacid dehalogenase superfamily)
MRNAVFFDIDGTLAIRRDVPESASASISQLRSQGDYVFICTGRNASYVRRHFSSYADGFICANGRYAFMNDRVLYDHPIETELLVRAHDTVLSNGGGIIFFGNTHAYYAGDEEGYERFCTAHAGEPVGRLSSFSETDPVYTFDVFFHSEDELQRITEALCDFCIFNPHLPWPTADVTVLPHDKGTALASVITQLGIARDHTYAFGDGHNDLCMFREAGHTIAMGNAVAELKHAAEHITTDILADGVRNGLQHYGLL